MFLQNLTFLNYRGSETGDRVKVDGITLFG